MRIDLLPETTTDAVRERACALCEPGLDQRIVLPPVHEDLFGPSTAPTLELLRSTLERMRPES